MNDLLPFQAVEHAPASLLLHQRRYYRTIEHSRSIWVLSIPAVIVCGGIWVGARIKKHKAHPDLLSLGTSVVHLDLTLAVPWAISLKLFVFDIIPARQKLVFNPDQPEVNLPLLTSIGYWHLACQACLLTIVGLQMWSYKVTCACSVCRDAHSRRWQQRVP